MRFAFCGWLLWSSLVAAQSPSAVLAGRVTDPSGLAAPGAAVRVMALDRELQRATRADAAGWFRLDGLPAGAYRVEVEHAGFARYEVARVELQVRQTVELSVTLRLGPRTEVVRIEETITPLDAAPAAVGFTVSQVEVRELPLAVRNFVGLAALGPGVVPRHLSGFTGDIFTGAQPGRGAVALNPAINGIRSTANTFLLDGILNTDGNVNALVVSPPLEAIQEFRVQTSMAGAEFGYAGGGVVNMVTRSGGPRLRGGLFEFLRNEKLDAYAFFDDRTQPKPSFKQSQFGAQAGGPLPKLTEWSFFASYEGLRSALGHTAHLKAPNARMRAGDFSGAGPVRDPLTGQAFPGNRVPEARIDSAARLFLEKYQPLPNAPDDVYIDTTPDRRSTDTASLRLDRHSARWGSFFGRYTINEDRATIAGNFPVLPSAENIRAQHLTLGHTWSGRNAVNDLRLGWQRLAVSELQRSAFQHDVIGELGITGIDRDPVNWGLPLINVGSVFVVVDDQQLPQAQRDQLLQVVNQLTARRGAHTWSAGGEARWFLMNFMQRRNSRGMFNFSGQHSGDNFADFLLGFPGSTERTTGIPQAYLRRPAWALYAQDEWNARPGLKLSAGIRYNYTAPFVEKRDHMFNLDFSTIPNPPALAPAGGKLGRSLVEPDRNDFAPRFGMAWQPAASGLGRRFLFRGGYGWFYSPEIAVETYALVRNTTRVERNVAPPGPPVLTLRNGFPSGASTGFPTYFGLDPRARTPYVQQWNGGWQVSAGATVIEAAYIGTKGVRLGRFRRFNTPLQVELGRNLAPRPGSLQSLRSFPTLGDLFQRQHLATSSYHALQIRAERRFARALQFQGSFTWSKNLDDADSVIPGLYESWGAQDERNLRLERGPSFFDVRRRLTFHSVYDLPFGKNRRWATGGVAARWFGGWSISGIFLMQDGTPENPVYFFTDHANSGTPNRPNLVPGKPIHLPRDRRSVERWFNTAAFSDPAPYTFGNAGRNIVPTPGVILLDLAVHRRFSFGEARDLEFRAEFFNSTNHSNLGVPLPNPDFGPFFGRLFVSGAPRRVQLALKLSL